MVEFSRCSSALWILLVALLACSESVDPAPQEAQCTDCLEDQSIEALIEMGSDPEGPLYDGNSLGPLKELRKRPRERVIAELRKRLGNPQFAGKYRDAFVVYAMRHLLVRKLEAELLERYPTLDEGGRYEVLVYGARYGLSSYVPLFVELLERSKPVRVERRDLLAAHYATSVPSESLLPGLRRLGDRIGADGPEPKRTGLEFDSDCLDFHDLDGFPYRGLAMLSICERAASVRRAISFIEGYQPIQPMSAEEEALSDRVRDALLDPVRRRIEINDLSLEEAYREVWRVFEMEPDKSTLWTLRNAEGKTLASKVTFRSEHAAASEVVAAICNQTGLLVSHGFRAALLGSGNSLMHNSCIAADGMVFQVRIYPGNPPHVSGFVNGAASLDWVQLPGRSFELDAAILPGGVEVGDQFELGVRGGQFSLEMDPAKWRDVERIEELRGTIFQPIPTAIRRIEVQPLVGKTVTMELEDTRTIAVQCVEANDGTWQLKITITRALGNWDFPVNPSTEIKLLLPETASPTARRPRHSSTTTGRSVEYRDVLPGTRVVWTYTAKSEALRIPVVWKSMAGASTAPSAR